MRSFRRTNKSAARPRSQQVVALGLAGDLTLGGDGQGSENKRVQYGR